MGSPGEPGPHDDSDPNDPPDRPHINITHGPANVMSGTTIGPTIQANVINGGVHVHYGRTPVTLPYRFGEVPPRTAGFQARAVAEMIGKTPDQEVKPHSRNARTVVLFGLSGMGKTQLAAAYAEQAWSSGEIDLLVWATASSRDLVVAEYAQLATELTGIEDSQPSRGASRLLSWLATTRARWLVVLDDLWKPSDLEGLWPPPCPSGRALVTTRRRDVALQDDRRHPIEIGLFTSEESAAYLRTRLTDPHLTDGLTELTHALEHVPTALARAADHLLQRHLSCAEYLERLYSRRRAKKEPSTAQDAQLDETETEAAALALSVEQADTAHPARSKGTSSDIRIVWFNPETGAASRVWTGTSAEKISIDEEWDRRVPPAHDHPPSTISTHDHDGSIHRVDSPESENRNDFLTLWSRLTKISLASPGRAAVRAHGIHKISSGNNTGYVQFDIAGRSARVHLDYKFTDYRPEHGVITTTHVQIY